MRITIETDAPDATAQVLTAPAADQARDGGPVPAELMAMAGPPGAGDGPGAADGAGGGTPAAPREYDGGPPPDTLLQRATGSSPPGPFTG